METVASSTLRHTKRRRWNHKSFLSVTSLSPNAAFCFVTSSRRRPIKRRGLHARAQWRPHSFTRTDHGAILTTTTGNSVFLVSTTIPIPSIFERFSFSAKRQHWTFFHKSRQKFPPPPNKMDIWCDEHLFVQSAPVQFYADCPTVRRVLTRHHRLCGAPRLEGTSAKHMAQVGHAQSEHTKPRKKSSIQNNTADIEMQFWEHWIKSNFNLSCSDQAWATCFAAKCVSHKEPTIFSLGALKCSQYSVPGRTCQSEVCFLPPPPCGINVHTQCSQFSSHPPPRDVHVTQWSDAQTDTEPRASLPWVAPSYQLYRLNTQICFCTENSKTENHIKKFCLFVKELFCVW